MPTAPRSGAAACPRVVVVGLGPAGPEGVGEETRRVVARAGRAFLRTARHPAAQVLGKVPSFDRYYERARTFQEVYGAIVDDLVAAARTLSRTAGYVAYAVPGSPLVAEHTVELLRHDPRVTVDVRPALSFLDLAWLRLGVDPVASGVRLIDGTTFARSAAGATGPLLVAQCWSSAVLSEIKLSVESQEGAMLPPVTVLHHLGLADERTFAVQWHDLDRNLDADHLTSLWIPRLAEPVGAELIALDELTRTLRRECPWDRQQTHRSLRHHLIEESYEVIDAIDELDRGAGGRRDGPDAVDVVDAGVEARAVDHLCEELGDLLFQVVIHARLAAEQGRFTLSDVARSVQEKLVARHPHVFGDVQAETAQAVAARWEALKAREKRRSSVLEGIPAGLPALSLSSELLGRAERWSKTTGVATQDLVDAFPDGAEERLAQLLFVACVVARHLGLDPELALRERARRFGAGIGSREQAAVAGDGAPSGASTDRGPGAH